MCTIKENQNKIGFGSWASTQSFNDYKDQMSYKEFDQYVKEQCKKRIDEAIQKGDLVKVTYVGGHKVRNYTGTFQSVSENTIYIKQNKKDVFLYATLIDDIQILNQ